ncbi:hypothetical protein EON65_20770 [archaeon]|nr:MAG: hypothetical protein EON65_20770 [archaeon]
MNLDYQNNRHLPVTTLCTEDISGNRSHFLETLRSQHLSEMIAFDKHLTEVYDSVVKEGEGGESGVGGGVGGTGTSGSGGIEVSISKIREALCQADPNKPRSDINTWLCLGTKMTVEEVLLAEAKKVLVCAKDFKNSLRMHLLKKSPPSINIKVK